MLSEFGTVFVFIITGIVLISAILFMGKLVAPDNPTPEKLASYECGMEPSGNSWVQFNSRFYVIALVFLLFDVELAFIFPVATVFGDENLIAADSRWGWLALGELFIFITILFLGLIYAWNKGDLNWITPVKRRLSVPVPIRPNLYDKINAEVYEVKPFSGDKIVDVVTAAATATSPSPARKPAFKPTFKKSE